MKLTIFSIIYLACSLLIFGQKIKSIEDDYSTQYFNIQGDLTKKIIHQNNESKEEWNYSYEKNKHKLITKQTTYYFQDKLQEIKREFSDTLLIKESVYQRTKFGTEVTSKFYKYDNLRNKTSVIEIDSLRGDTLKYIQFKYSGDTITETEVSKTFTKKTITYPLDSCNFRSMLLINNETKNTFRFEMNLYYPIDNNGWTKILSWSQNRWTLNGLSANEYILLNQNGYALTSSTKSIKNNNGEVIEYLSRTGNKISSFKIKYEYY